jgi:hypothetical protein
MTEKAVWHIVKDWAQRIGLENLAPHDLRRYAACGVFAALARDSAMPQGESWSRFSSFWTMSPFR